MVEKYLITGGAGFLGLNFTLYLKEKLPHCAIIIIDKKLPPFLERDKIKIINLNLSEKIILEDIVGKVDYIINFASETHVDRSLISPAVFINSNISLIINLLEYARKIGVKKFIHLSSDEVYGPTPVGRSFNEKQALKPSNPYAASKASQDLILFSYFKSYGLPVVILRLSNCYGRYQHPEKLIPLAIIHALSDLPIPLYGKGQYRRTWLYITDAVEAIYLALTQGEAGQIYNISSYDEYSNLEVVRMILDKLGKSKQLIRFISDRPSHDRRYSLDCTKVKNWGWEAKTDFSSGIDMTIRWYQENENWWRLYWEQRLTPLNVAVLK